jgi:uncharacterized protein YeaC (DUF1315 family)
MGRGEVTDEDDIQIENWWNMQDPVHRQALRTFINTGKWPRGFLPSNVKQENPLWLIVLFEHMAWTWMEQQDGNTQ